MHWKALQGSGGVSQPQGCAPQGRSANTTCCKGAAREALGALLKRRTCLRNLIQQILGLWAEVKAFLEPTTKCVGRCCWCCTEGSAGGQVQEAAVHCPHLGPAPFAASQLPAAPQGFSSFPGQPQDAAAEQGLQRGCGTAPAAVPVWLSLAVSAWTGRTEVSPARWGPHPTQAQPCAATMRTCVPCSSQKWESNFINEYSKVSYTEQKFVFFFCEELYLFVLGRGWFLHF